MTQYISMWKNFFNFKDRTTRKGYWMAFLFHVIASLILSVLAQIVSVLGILSGLYALAALIPFLAMAIRRIRDAGKPWFFIFIPIYNFILLFIPSAPADSTPVV